MNKDIYWEKKIQAFLHDPPHKFLSIATHVDLSKELLEMIKGYTLDENVHQVSDMIASAADRPPMPLYKESMLKVDVNDMGLEITHPISPESINVKKELPMSTEVHKLLKKWFNNIAHESPKKIFLSLWRVLPQFLAENEKKLGPIWHLVPADTRTPDHSIWHHSSLVSALSICEGKPAFFIFSLAPVQGYIAEARKTKDLWIGSMVLSYLSWLGMKVIATDLGPDHIIYPSLRNQPIVDLWLRDEEGLEITVREPFTASFPNKFVAIIPKDMSKEIGQKVTNGVLNGWKNLANEVKELVEKKLFPGSGGKGSWDETWKRQIEHHWEINWVSIPWFGKIEEYEPWLSASVLDDIKKWVEFSQSISDYKINIGTFYNIAHQLAQKFSASRKALRYPTLAKEEGDKCSVCGYREILHPDLFSHEGGESYRQQIRNFWDELSLEFKGEIKRGERLCAICLMKRLLDKGNEVIFAKKRRFLSTPRLAAEPFIRKIQDTEVWSKFLNVCENDDNKAAFYLLNDNLQEEEKIEKDELKEIVKAKNKIINYAKNNHIESKRSPYFAVLLMDGDHMGKLISGEGIKARWRDIMHSSIIEQLKGSGKGKKWFEQDMIEQQRRMGPSIHAAISEALTNFSISAVPTIIHHFGGELVYAGGDDLLALMPTDRVLKAAKFIREIYRSAWFIKEKNLLPEKYKKLYENSEIIMPSMGEGCTISACIIIAHHKDPLRGLIKRAHYLLDKMAKEKGGRDAIAVSLKKRGGGERIFVNKWDYDGDIIKKIEEFTEILSDLKASSKMIYNLNNFFEVLSSEKIDEGDRKKFIASMIERNRILDEEKKGKEWEETKLKRAEMINKLLNNKASGKRLDHSALLIARHLAGGGK